MNKELVAGKAIRLDPRRIIRVGGEGDGYELPGARAPQLYHAPHHPAVVAAPPPPAFTHLKIPGP